MKMNFEKTQESDDKVDTTHNQGSRNSLESVQVAVYQDKKGLSKDLRNYIYYFFISILFNVLLQFVLVLFRVNFPMQRLVSSILFITIVSYPFTFFFVRLLYTKHLRLVYYVIDLCFLLITWKFYLKVINAISMFEKNSTSEFLYDFQIYNAGFLETYMVNTVSTRGPFFTLLATLFMGGPILLIILFSLYFYNSHPDTKSENPKSLEKELKLQMLHTFPVGVVLLYFTTRLHSSLSFLLAVFGCIIISLSLRKIIDKIMLSIKTYYKSSSKHQLAVTSTLSDFIYKYDMTSLMEGINKVSAPFANDYCSLYEDYIFVSYQLIRNTKEIDITKLCKIKVFILEYTESQMKELTMIQKDEVLTKIKELLGSNVRIFINYRSFVHRNEKIDANVLGNMSLATKELRSLPLTFHRQTDYEDFTELKRFIREEVYQSPNSKLYELINKFFYELPKGNKFGFVVQKVSNLTQNNATEAFYDIMKSCEYMIHYRALYMLANQNTDNNNEITFSMGSWQSLQEEGGKPIEDSTVLEAYKLVLDLLSNSKEQVKKRIFYNDITRILVRLRNKYIGHGTLTYSISEELLNCTIVLTGKVYELFLRDGYQLTMESFIAKEDIFDELQVKEERIPCCNSEDPLELLYNIRIVEGIVIYEYIDYVSGNIIGITGQEVKE